MWPSCRAIEPSPVFWPERRTGRHSGKTDPMSGRGNHPDPNAGSSPPCPSACLGRRCPAQHRALTNKRKCAPSNITRGRRAKSGAWVQWPVGTVFAPPTEDPRRLVSGRGVVCTLRGAHAGNSRSLPQVGLAPRSGPASTTSPSPIEPGPPLDRIPLKHPRLPGVRPRWRGTVRFSLTHKARRRLRPSSAWARGRRSSSTR